MDKNLINKLKSENKILKKEVNRLRRLSYIDELTGLYNKVGFEHTILSALSMVRREKSRLCLGIFDIDRFKQVNDRLGHKEGDRMLVMFADVLKKYTRLGDILSRWGGDEFVIALPLARFQDALDVGERIRDHVEKKYKRNKYPVTISGAFAEVSFSNYKNNDKKDIVSLEKIYENIFKQADKKLLSIAKVSKNKIV